MKYLSGIIAALVVTVTVNSSNAQTFGGLKDRNGKYIDQKEYSEVNGSPYLASDWGIGMVTFENGSDLKNVPLKYDMVKDILIFSDSTKTQTLSFNDPVKEFMINYIDKDNNDRSANAHFRNGFSGIPRTTTKSYFEVLEDGTVKLLKKNSKGVIITQDFNSASKVQNIKDDIKYYLIIDGKAVVIKNDKKSIIAQLPAAKQAQMTDYAKANNIGKSDADLAKLIMHYNSL